MVLCGSRTYVGYHKEEKKQNEESTKLDTVIVYIGVADKRAAMLEASLTKK